MNREPSSLLQKIICAATDESRAQLAPTEDYMCRDHGSESTPMALIFVEIDDFPASLNLLGLDHNFSGMGCRATDFDSECVVE